MKKYNLTLFIGLSCFFISNFWCNQSAFAQSVKTGSYPSKSIRWVIPFPPGGATDTLGRFLAFKLSETWGQTVVLDYKPGAGTTIGVDFVAKSPPDGLTIGMVNSSFSVNPTLRKKLPYDTQKDLAGVTQLFNMQLAIVARPDAPFNNLKELIEYVKVNKDKVSLANAGLGAVSHLCGMMFQTAIGVDLNTIPYKGTGPAMNDLMGGQVDLLCDQTTQTVPIIKDNRVKVYGVTTLNRLQALPNVPTLDEQGLKGFEVKVWHGMYAPKGTPKPALDRINLALREALADPMVKQRMVDLSSDIPPLAKITPQSLQTHLEAEIAKWGPVIRKAGIYAD